MNKRLLKFTSVLVSALTLASQLAPFATSADSLDFENNITTENQYPTTVDGTDYSSYATGDLTLEEGMDVDEADIIKSVSDYQNATGGKLNIHSSGDAKLPSSVDNSASEYFPAIGNQGALGSCTTWAQVYYQYSYTVNKLMDRPATADNTFSPKWVYNKVNGGIDIGSGADSVYHIMKQFGNVPISMLPYDDDYLSWAPQEEYWKTAARYRVKDFQHFDDFGDEDSQITSPDDSDLEPVKTALANGDVLAYSTCIYSWNEVLIKQNSTTPENDKYVGEKAIYAQLGYDGAHRMAIVGYNDDLWIDVNQNDVVDDGEMGAFKIVNSWGDGYGNGGFIWVAYDALNKTSCVKNGPASDKRCAIFSYISRMDVYPVDANSNLFFTCTLNSSDRTQSAINIIAEKDGTQTTYRPFYGGGKLSFDGTTNANDGTFSIPLEAVDPEITAESFKDYSWTVRFEDEEQDGIPLTIKDAKIENCNTNTSYQIDDNFPVTIDGGECTFNLKEKESSNLVVYYLGFDNAHIHYKKDNGEWNSVEGDLMELCYERRGYTQKFVIPSDDPLDISLYFTAENGKIDDNNGQYFSAKSGLNYFVTENAHPPLQVEMTNDFNSISDIKRNCLYNVKITGGYETYKYKFTRTNLDTGEVEDSTYQTLHDLTVPLAGGSFQNEGRYRVTISVIDFSDTEVTESQEITVKDIPFVFKDFKVTSSGENIVAGQEIILDAVTDNEEIRYAGMKSWNYKLDIKRNGESYYTDTVYAKTCEMGYKTCTIEAPFIPSKGGTYEVTISRTDALEQYAEKTITFEVKDRKIGDAGLDGDINSVDVLLIQRYDINLADDTEINLETADSNKDGVVSLRDATCIQRYAVKYSNSGSVGEVIEFPDPKPENSDTDTSTDTSTDTNTDTDTQTDTDVDDTNTVTFTNSHNWGGQIYCYYWSDSNKNMTAWPGEPMTNSGINGYNQTMYTFTVPKDATYIIFSNGSAQTVDISYPGGNLRYYPLTTTDSKGHYEVALW